MKDLTVQNILEVTNGKLLQGNPEMICRSFSKDTRSLQEHDIYIAIKGGNFDGNLFWEKAFEQGADGVIVSSIDYSEQVRGRWNGKAIIQVEDTEEALYKVASFKRSLYDIPVIAVTGSVGKTSTKDIIANVVSQKYRTLKTIGNNNNNIGLPFTILRLQDEEAMVLEMGMNHLGEINLLSKIAKPNICVITNIGTSHIGNLGSRENILKAKLEILDGADNPVVIINEDDDLLRKWQQKNNTQINIKTFGIEFASDINASQIVLKENSSEFYIQQENTKVKVPVGGKHFILNALCAFSVGKALKMKNEEIVKGIENFQLTAKRMEIKETKNGIKIINDAYNASLESMQASLNYLSKCKAQRKIAVLGDMLELGNYAEKLHKKVGEAVYQDKIDFLIVNGYNARYIAEGAKEIGMPEKNILYIENKEDILNKLKQILQTGDIVLFKASNGMKFFDLVETIEKEW